MAYKGTRMKDQFYLLGNMLTSVNSIWKIGKTVISAVGGKLVFRKFQVYSSRTQGVKKIEAI